MGRYSLVCSILIYLYLYIHILSNKNVKQLTVLDNKKSRVLTILNEFFIYQIKL